MVSLGSIPRTIPDRASYHANPVVENGTKRWSNAAFFWGKNNYRLDAPPGIIGMISTKTTLCATRGN